MAKKIAKKVTKKTDTSTIARADDGTIQITITFAWSDVESVMDHVLEEEGLNITIPGFRPGKAPKSKVKEKISGPILIEKTVSHLYSKIVTEIVDVHKIKPIIYPRVEVLKALEGSDWEIRATTCEMPKFELGDYRKNILSASISSKETTTLSKPEKEQKILSSLLESIKIAIPKVLIDDEVNNKLSQLLARIEKLGLQLESYLTSVGKNPDGLRKEYETQAIQNISLELILSKIADADGVKVEESEIDMAIEAATANDPKSKEKLNTSQQRDVIKSVLARRTVLDSLTALL